MAAQSLDIESIRQDRKILQERWRSLGYYPDKTLSQALHEGVERYPDVESYYYSGDDENQLCRLSNRDIFQAGLGAASALRTLGIGPGDVVAVQLPTCHEAAILYQGIIHLGATVLPIVHMYGEAEVAFVLRQSRARMLVLPTRWRNTDYIPRYARFQSLPDLRHLVAVGPGVPSSCVDAKHLLATPAAEFVPHAAHPDEIALLMYTSGTTSSPKGVQHTHNTLLWEWGRPAYNTQSLYLSCLPAGHYTGFSFMLRPSIYGAPTVFVDRWTPSFAARLIEKHRIGESGGTPIFLTTLLKAAQESGADLGSLKHFGMGGASITPSQVAEAAAAGFVAGRIYGSTEHPTVTWMTREDSPEKRGYTDGGVDEGNEVRIIDEQGNDLPVGSEGEIVTRGPELFVGYSDPALDLECFMPGGWFRTGDIGRLDRDNHLTITDRKKDIIIRGGENISSKEVEDVLADHPAVAEVAVVPMPDPVYGEKVCAYVVCRPGQALTLDEVKAHFLSAGVSKQKIPERLLLVEQFSRTPSGKVKKFELRQTLRESA
ncbi:MAG: AMP-binding protein [Proteobacteria bacterium]|nr:AMP-binding protein [Pseudomonadota bacterium]HQR04408.1 AMP-binding protein [Rhodocyclaceae bacterium]